MKLWLLERWHEVMHEPMRDNPWTLLLLAAVLAITWRFFGWDYDRRHRDGKG